MSQVELAKHLKYSTSKVNELIEGEIRITKERALKLERVLGVSAGFWMNLEKMYEEALIEIKELNLAKT